MNRHRKGRLAPSPTGSQHLGNARTFLLAFWSAMHEGSELCLRIEDIDSPRVKSWAMDQAIEDLRWLGISWSGDPIVQTQRNDRYGQVLDSLRISNRIYPCVCSRRDIEQAASAPHESEPQHEGPRYPGTCASWRHGDALPKEQPYCWRFRVDDQELQFSDLISGTHRLNPARSLGDFPVTRKGSPTLTDRSNSSVHCYPPAAYQLAVVIDDMDQGVTDVVRGDDLVISTFRQIQLINVLGGSIPTYAHVPLVCGQDGRRLAKRHGDTRLASYREQGVAPETVVRWAAGVSGWNTANLSKLSLSELHLQLIDTFSWSSLPRDKVDRLL